MKNTKVIMWAFDGERYNYINEEWYNFTGYDKDVPLTIERWLEGMHPDDIEKSTQIWLEHWENKTAHENYFRLRRHDGVYRNFYVHATPVWDEHSNFVHFQGFNIDITEKLAIEQALRESEEKFRLITENVPGSIFEFIEHPDGSTHFTFFSDDIRSVNPDIEKIDLNSLPRRDTELIIEEYHPIMEKAWEKARQSLEPYNVEFPIDINGKRIWQHSTAIPQKQPDGTVRWTGITLDITDKKQAVLFAEKLSQIAESSGDLHLICNDKGTITWSSKAFQEIIENHHPKNLIGTKPTERLHYQDEIHQQTVRAYEQALVKHEPFEGVLPFQALNGTFRWYSIKVLPIFDEKGIFQYSIVSKRDVSELIAQQEELKVLLDKTANQNTRLKEYAYITSHNIRSSVARLSGLIELIETFPNEPEYRSNLRKTLETLDNTLYNINELLHLEQDSSIDSKEDVVITEVIERVVELCRQDLETKQVMPEISITPKDAKSLLGNFILLFCQFAKAT